MISSEYKSTGNRVNSNLKLIWEMSVNIGIMNILTKNSKRIFPIILSGLSLFNCDTLLDIEPPKIEIIAPEEGYSYVATIPIELKVTDNRKVDRVEVFLDDQSVHLFTKGPFVTELDISEFEEKLMMLRVVTHDRAGNTAEAQLYINHSHGLKIVSPNGSEVWPERSTQTITWERCGAVANYVSLYYSINEGSSWTQIIASTPNDGSYPWTLPTVSETHTACRVRVSCIDASHSDMADDDFMITDWSPVLVGSCDPPGNPIGIFVTEDYAYMTAGYGGLHIINVSEPASSTLIGSYETPGTKPWDVFISGSYAYVADGFLGLHIINVSNPASPTLARSYDTPYYAYGVFVSGSYAYVADGNTGLHIINVSNPASPTLAGSYDTPGYAHRVFISGNYAYVADGNAGLHIINVSNPASPTLARSYDTPYYAYGVFVSGSYAYVADGNAGLHIINVSNPASPTLAGSYDTPGCAHNVFISGNYAYVADMRRGLQIINVSNPASPTPAGSIDITSANPMDVFVSGNYAYLTDHGFGLLIFDISGLL